MLILIHRPEKAKNNSLLGAKLTLCSLYGVWGNGFHKESQVMKKKFFSLNIIFSCYYCSIDLKQQLEHAWFCPETSSLIRFCKHYEA